MWWKKKLRVGKNTIVLEGHALLDKFDQMNFLLCVVVLTVTLSHRWILDRQVLMVRIQDHLLKVQEKG